MSSAKLVSPLRYPPPEANHKAGGCGAQYVGANFEMKNRSGYESAPF